MASIIGKKRGGATYYYLAESARVGGKPRIVSQEYLGTAEELAAAMRGGGLGLPGRVRHKDFGAVAAAWGLLEDLGVAGIIDEVSGARRAGAAASTGTYLVLAALNRVVAPCSKLGFADWWAKTSAPRFTRIPATVLDHRRFWDAMHAVTLEDLEEISRRIALAIVDLSGLDCSSVALDMTNFATFIATGNQKAPVAQRGKARQKRSGLRLVGLGLVVTRDGGIPLTWHAYPGDRPDVTQFPDMISQLRRRYEAITGAAGVPAGSDGPADMTVVFDAGQNSGDNFAHLAKAGLRYVGSVPASDCGDLTALPGSRRAIADKDRFGGLTAYDTRRQAYGAARRAILTHSPEYHDSQAAGFDGTTMAKAGKKLDELAATLARGKTRRPRDKVETEIASITARPWVRRVVTWQLSGDQPRDLRLTWSIDPGARAALEEELFGKHVLITDHDDWPVSRGDRRLPVPVRSRVLLPAAQRPPRRLLLPDAPLDRAQHQSARVHLRARPADRPPDAAQSPPRRAGPVRPLTAGRTRRHQRDHPALPRRPRAAQSPPHPHRHHQRPGQARKDLRPRPVRAQTLTWVIHQTQPATTMTSGNKPKINLSRKLRLGQKGDQALPGCRTGLGARWALSYTLVISPRPAPRLAWLDAGTARRQAVACLAGRKPGEQVAQQVPLVWAEGIEQLGFGVIARPGHACLDPPAGRGDLGDAGPAIVRVETAHNQLVCFQPVEQRGQGGLVQPQCVTKRQLSPPWFVYQGRQHDPVAHPGEPLGPGYLVKSGSHALRNPVEQPGQIGWLAGCVGAGGRLCGHALSVPAHVTCSQSGYSCFGSLL